MYKLPSVSAVHVIIALMLIRFIRWIYFCIYRPINLSKYQVQRKADGRRAWAVVTGATDGIGRAFSQLLLEQGFNVLLVSRTEEKLIRVAGELKNHLISYREARPIPEADSDVVDDGPQVDWVVSDASNPSEDSIQPVVQKMSGKNFSILINNVGVGQGGRMTFHELDPLMVTKTIQVNCTYQVLLSQKIFPLLLSNKECERKLVVNVSSVLGDMVMPFSSVYAATKSFVRHFSNCIAIEYLNMQIDVVNVAPGLVSTNMTGNIQSVMASTSRQCAVRALSQVPQMNIIPHWKHAVPHFLHTWFQKIFPEKLFSYFSMSYGSLVRRMALNLKRND